LIRWSTVALGLAASACSSNLTHLDADAGPADEVPSCLPNLDGVLDSSEVPTLLDREQDFLIASNVAVQLGPSPWALRGDLPGERKLALVARSSSDAWFADQVDPASFTFPLDGDGKELAVLVRDDSALHMVGIASSKADTTLLRYATPIVLLRFPMSAGDSWQSESEVSGTLDGLPYNGSDFYEIAVSERGPLELPHLRFDDAYRLTVHTTSVASGGGVSVETQQSLFMSECFGEVARATSEADESDPDVFTAEELRRFSL
jgi:hypothetical protein